MCDPASPKQAWAKALQGVTLPSVRAFVFDTPHETPAAQRRNALGDLAAVLTACPQLERLFATGDLALGPVRHDALRELTLLGEPLSAGVLEGLGRSELPALERLSLSLATEGRPVAVPVLLQALRSLRAPVREVHLAGLERVDEVLEALVTGGLPPSWRTLTLQGGWSGDGPETLPALLQRHASALGALELLGLPEGAGAEGLPVRTAPALEARVHFLPAAYEAW